MGCNLFKRVTSEKILLIGSWGGLLLSLMRFGQFKQHSIYPMAGYNISSSEP
jgi:hypothetical protein